MAVEQIKTAISPTAVPPAKGKREKKEAETASEGEQIPLEMPAGKVADYIVDEIEEFPLHALISIDDEEHPLFDPRAGKVIASQEFLDSVKTQGQLEPGKVFPMGNGKYFVLAGNQRVHALRAAGIAKFKAQRVRPEVGDLGALYIQVATNEHRTDDAPDAKARRMAHVLKLTGNNVKDVASMFKVTPQTVRNATKLLEADPKLRQAVADRIIQPTTAINIITETGGDKAKQKAKAEKAYEMSKKLGDAKVVTGQKAKKAKAPKAITAAQLLTRAPGKNLVREVVSNAKLNAQANTLAQWYLGEIDSETMLSLIPEVKKIWNKLENAPFEVE